MGLFLFPQSIPSGGAGGLAILLNYYVHMPLGPTLWLVNFLGYSDYRVENLFLKFNIHITLNRIIVWNFINKFMIVYNSIFIRRIGCKRCLTTNSSYFIMKV